MDSEQFEKRLANSFRTYGYSAELTPATSDRGVDILLRIDSAQVAVQAKYYSEGNKVGSPTIQKASGLLQRTEIDQVIVVTTSDFTSEAEAVADNRDVKLRLSDSRGCLISSSETKLSPSDKDSNINLVSDDDYPTKSTGTASASKTDMIKSSEEKDSNGDDLSWSDREDKNISVVKCPNCGKEFQRTGWFPYVSHFLDCEVPTSIPEGMSAEKWNKIKQKLREREAHQNSYECPHCRSEIDDDSWFTYYDHFRDCKLPDDRPAQLSRREWQKCKKLIISPEISEIEYVCPTCGHEFEEKKDITRNWFRYANHFDNCRLPDAQPEPLSLLEWKKINTRL